MQFGDSRYDADNQTLTFQTNHFQIMPLHIKMWKSPDRRAEMIVTAQRKINQQEYPNINLFTADRWYNRLVRVYDCADCFSNSNHRMVNLKKEENGIKKMTSTPVDLPQEFFRINRDIWYALTIKVGASFLIFKKIIWHSSSSHVWLVEKWFFLRKYRPNALWNLLLVREYFIFAKKTCKRGLVNILLKAF